MKKSTIVSLLFMVLLLAFGKLSSAQPTTFNITDYGAKPAGVAKIPTS